MAEPDPSLTPEKQLLKLIEEPVSAQQAAAAKAKTGFHAQSLLSPNAWKGRLAYAQENFLTILKQSRDQISLKQINQVFRMAMVMMGAGLTMNLTYDAQLSMRDYNAYFEVSQKEIAEMPASGGRMLDPNFFEDIAKRNIFSPIQRKAEAKAAVPAESLVKLQEMLKDYKLTGISVNPVDVKKTYCMIEDLKKNTTHFLKVGDKISGAEVLDIGSDGVVLAYGNETAELK